MLHATPVGGNLLRVTVPISILGLVSAGRGGRWLGSRANPYGLNGCAPVVSVFAGGLWELGFEHGYGL